MLHFLWYLSVNAFTCLDFLLFIALSQCTSIQMGQLFAQMATLVSEQSEVIQRIEDDVESGLVDTLEAQGHIQQVYDITKGNRSMILKIFALLVVFIFLFLVWT
jgi:t-SNARE complex subunit (syntaxin)